MSAANFSLLSNTTLSVLQAFTERSDFGHHAGKPWDNTDPFFSAKTRLLIVNIFKCYIRMGLMFLGIPGNVLCCVVFWKQGLRKDRINLLLFFLAVTDGLSLSLQLPMKVTCYLSDPVLIQNLLVIINAKLARMYLCCSFISGALIVVMSVERCLSVLLPFRARRLLTYRSMVVAILLSYLIPILGYFPFFLGDDVRWRVDPSTNRSLAYMVTVDWFSSNRLHRRIANYLGIIGQPVFFVTVVVCNTMTVVHLRRTSRKRSELTGNVGEEDGSSDNKITVMLLFISVIYAILLVSQICSYIIQFFVPEFVLNRKYHNSFVVMYQVFVFTCSFMNSTVNFFGYLALSSRFRKTLKEIWFSCCPRGKKTSG